MNEKRSVIKGIFQPANRGAEIAAVFTKHGLQSFVKLMGFGSHVDDAADPDLDHHGLAIRIRKVCEDLGPTFIKLGQILSTRPDVLPPVFITELQRLQDNAPAIPVSRIKEQIEAGLHASVEDLFENFDDVPIATASMAQVHRATLKNGDEVVVKVQRPGIESQIENDLALLYYAARFFEATIEEVGIYNPVAIVKEFEKAITEELNFLTEARNTELAREYASKVEGVVISKIYTEFSSPKVITQSYIDGVSIHDIEPGTERGKHFVDIAMEAAFVQIFEDGFFHGDPHPGNMLVTEDGVAFLDWGLVGRLSRAQQDQLVDIIVSIIANDLDGVTRLVMRMGKPEGRVNMRALRSGIAEVAGRYRSLALEQIEITAFMTDVMDLAHEHRIRVNPEYALLTKATATVEGILRTVYPDLDIVGTMKGYAQRLLRERYDTQRVMQGVVSTAVNLNQLLRDVPMQLDQLLMDVEGGNLQIQVSHPALDEHSRAVTILGTRILMGFVTAGLIIGGAVLIAPFSYQVYDISLTPIIGAMFLMTSMGIGLAAIFWHFVTGGPRKIRLSPWFRWLRRK